jgi:hypothetical protein
VEQLEAALHDTLLEGVRLSVAMLLGCGAAVPDGSLAARTSLLS